MADTTDTAGDGDTVTEVTEPESTAVEAADTQLPHHSFFTRLYTGTGAFEVVGRRKLWFAISGLIMAIAVASILLKGFTFGIDFEGGTKMSFPRGDASVTQVEQVFQQALGKSAESVVVVGNDADAVRPYSPEGVEHALLVQQQNIRFGQEQAAQGHAAALAAR